MTTAVASRRTLSCSTVGAKKICPTPRGCVVEIVKKTATATASATTLTIASGRSTSAACATDLAPFTSAAALALTLMPSENAADRALKMPTRTVSATTKTIVSARLTLAASATAWVLCTNVDAAPSPKTPAIVTATQKMPWAFAEAGAKKMPTLTASATTWTNASGPSTSVANATALERFSSVDVTKSKTANATATETSKTLWACVAALARPTWTPMESATTSTSALAKWTNAVNAMARVLSLNAVATNFKKANATAKATSRTSLANVGAIAPPTWTTMAFATTKTIALEPSTRVGFATVQDRFTSVVATTSKKASAIASEARRMPLESAEVDATSTWTLTASATT